MRILYKTEVKITKVKILNSKIIDLQKSVVNMIDFWYNSIRFSLRCTEIF